MKTIKIPGIIISREIEMHSLSIRESRNLGNIVRNFVAKFEKLDKKEIQLTVMDLINEGLDYLGEFIPRITDLSKEDVEGLDYNDLEILLDKFMEINGGFLKLLDYIGVKVEKQVPTVSAA